MLMNILYMWLSIRTPYIGVRKGFWKFPLIFKIYPCDHQFDLVHRARIKKLTISKMVNDEQNLAFHVHFLWKIVPKWQNTQNIGDFGWILKQFLSFTISPILLIEPNWKLTNLREIFRKKFAFHFNLLWEIKSNCPKIDRLWLSFELVHLSNLQSQFDHWVPHQKLIACRIFMAEEKFCVSFPFSVKNCSKMPKNSTLIDFAGFSNQFLSLTISLIPLIGRWTSNLSSLDLIFRYKV